MIISVEGQNGVGKSTVSKALGKVYEAIVMRSPDYILRQTIRLRLK
jgi:thymidylate kinase